MATRPLRIIWVAIVIALLAPAVVLADADPASDVLLGQNVFYPYSPAVSADLQRILNAATTAAHRARFPIKLAIIGAPQDLGAVTSLFGKPQTYADFLYRELGSFASEHPPLLIVMPNGFGVQGMNSAARSAAASLAKPTSSQSDDLARAAIVAVGKLAAAAGHRIRIASVPRATGHSGGHVSTPITVVIFALIAAAIAAGIIRYRQMQPPSH